jgi:VIT1/CCC1 family predicted Fe2+/Mn2+ transporter
VDYLEAEINLLFTLILPLVGVAVVVARFVTAAELVQFSLSTLIGAAILLLMWAYVVYSVYRAASSRQRGERRDTLRNFVIGNCYQAADRRTAFL